MSFIISVYPLEVTVLLVTGAGDTGRGLPWFRGWAGAPRSCSVLPGTLRDGAVTDSPGCPAATLLCRSLLRSAAKG